MPINHSVKPRLDTGLKKYKNHASIADTVGEDANKSKPTTPQPEGGLQLTSVGRRSSLVAITVAGNADDRTTATPSRGDQLGSTTNANSRLQPFLAVPGGGISPLSSASNNSRQLTPKSREEEEEKDLSNNCLPCGRETDTNGFVSLDADERKLLAEYFFASTKATAITNGEDLYNLLLGTLIYCDQEGVNNLFEDYADHPKYVQELKKKMKNNKEQSSSASSPTSALRASSPLQIERSNNRKRGFDPSRVKSTLTCKGFLRVCDVLKCRREQELARESDSLAIGELFSSLEGQMPPKPTLLPHEQIALRHWQKMNHKKDVYIAAQQQQKNNFYNTVNAATASNNINNNTIGNSSARSTASGTGQQAVLDVNNPSYNPLCVEALTAVDITEMDDELREDLITLFFYHVDVVSVNRLLSENATPKNAAGNKQKKNNHSGNNVSGRLHDPLPSKEQIYMTEEDYMSLPPSARVLELEVLISFYEFANEVEEREIAEEEERRKKLWAKIERDEEKKKIKNAQENGGDAAALDASDSLSASLRVGAGNSTTTGAGLSSAATLSKPGMASMYAVGNLLADFGLSAPMEGGPSADANLTLMAAAAAPPPLATTPKAKVASGLEQVLTPLSPVLNASADQKSSRRPQHDLPHLNVDGVGIDDSAPIVEAGRLEASLYVPITRHDLFEIAQVDEVNEDELLELVSGNKGDGAGKAVKLLNDKTNSGGSGGGAGILVKSNVPLSSSLRGGGNSTISDATAKSVTATPKEHVVQFDFGSPNDDELREDEESDSQSSDEEMLGKGTTTTATNPATSRLVTLIQRGAAQTRGAVGPSSPTLGASVLGGGGIFSPSSAAQRLKFSDVPEVEEREFGEFGDAIKSLEDMAGSGDGARNSRGESGVTSPLLKMTTSITLENDDGKPAALCEKKKSLAATTSRTSSQTPPPEKSPRSTSIQQSGSIRSTPRDSNASGATPASSSQQPQPRGSFFKQRINRIRSQLQGRSFHDDGTTSHGHGHGRASCASSSVVIEEPSLVAGVAARLKTIQPVSNRKFVEEQKKLARKARRDPKMASVSGLVSPKQSMIGSVSSGTDFQDAAERQFESTFASFEMGYHQYLYLPQLEDRPESTPIFVRKSFAPVPRRPESSASCHSGDAHQHPANNNNNVERSSSREFSRNDDGNRSSPRGGSPLDSESNVCAVSFENMDGAGGGRSSTPSSMQQRATPLGFTSKSFVGNKALLSRKQRREEEQREREELDQLQGTTTTLGSTQTGTSISASEFIDDQHSGDDHHHHVCPKKKKKKKKKVYNHSFLRCRVDEELDEYFHTPEWADRLYNDAFDLSKAYTHLRNSPTYEQERQKHKLLKKKQRAEEEQSLLDALRREELGLQSREHHHDRHKQQPAVSIDDTPLATFIPVVGQDGADDDEEDDRHLVVPGARRQTATPTPSGIGTHSRAATATPTMSSQQVHHSTSSSSQKRHNHHMFPGAPYMSGWAETNHNDTSSSLTFSEVQKQKAVYIPEQQRPRSSMEVSVLSRALANKRTDSRWKTRREVQLEEERQRKLMEQAALKKSKKEKQKLQDPENDVQSGFGDDNLDLRHNDDGHVKATAQQDTHRSLNDDEGEEDKSVVELENLSNKAVKTLKTSTNRRFLLLEHMKRKDGGSSPSAAVDNPSATPDTAMTTSSAAKDSKDTKKRKATLNVTTTTATRAAAASSLIGSASMILDNRTTSSSATGSRRGSLGRHTTTNNHPSLHHVHHRSNQPSWMLTPDTSESSAIFHIVKNGLVDPKLRAQTLQGNVGGGHPRSSAKEKNSSSRDSSNVHDVVDLRQQQQAAATAAASNGSAVGSTTSSPNAAKKKKAEFLSGVVDAAVVDTKRNEIV